MNEKILELVKDLGLVIQKKNGEDLICTRDGVPLWYTFHKSEEYILGFLNGLSIQKSTNIVF